MDHGTSSSSSACNSRSRPRGDAATWIVRVAARTIGAVALAFVAAPARPAEKPDDSFPTNVKPFIKTYCAECHHKDQAEADIDLTLFASLADVQKQPLVWEKVCEMLASRQMPPVDAKQPTDEERAKVHGWALRFLKEEAKRHAGDPGPVVLRRLSNAEYTYVIGDLTGAPSLRPAKEFPVDGAAGEGFTNTGNALVMSPALLAKYFDAGKQVATHAVLLPDGMRFSAGATRRDWTEEVLADIRGLYARYSDAKGGTAVNLQGIVFDTNGGGRIPLDRYFAATLAERDAIHSGKKSPVGIAKELGLSPKYLNLLWKTLENSPVDVRGKRAPSQLLDPLRDRWRTAKPGAERELAQEVTSWQQSLWRFTSVGHIGKVGGPKAWMEPVNPLATREDIRLKIPDAKGNKEVVLYLAVSDAGDGHEHDDLLWERPRLVAPGRPDLLLKDVRAVTGELEIRRRQIFASAAKSLSAAAELTAATSSVDVKELAKEHDVEPDVLASWLDYLGVGTGGPAKIGALIARPLASQAGYDFVKGWTGDDALSIVANSSDQHVRIPGNLKGHGIAVHPSPTLQVAVAWRSPAAATLKISGEVQHAHPECGNGVTWALELRRGATRQRLAGGVSHGATKVPVGPVADIAVQPGDVVALLIGPRDGNHSCDLTAIDLVLHDGKKEWNLAKDISPNILAGNPHADQFGNAGVWSFFSEPATGAAGHVIPAQSLLAKWQSSGQAEERTKLAAAVQQLLETGPDALPQDSPDRALHRQLTSLDGPLAGTLLHALAAKKAEKAPPAGDSSFGLDPKTFGKHPDGSAIEPASLCVRAPSVIEVRLPADLVQGAEFVASAYLHPATGKEGSVQAQVLTEKPLGTTGLQQSGVQETNAAGMWTSNNRRIAFAKPILVNDGSAARKRFEAAFEEFRQLFPAALCYAKIVPVDEVVTLTLYHREDEPLRRLMLSDDETALLNRKWDELHYISHDALALVDAYEQLLQYATQDADPKVFEPMRKPIYDSAAAFRKLLTKTEPAHVEAVLEFAGRAYRRPLTEQESSGLRSLYKTFRAEGLDHDGAVRFLLARVLVSPAFLYRAEKGTNGPLPAGATGPEFARTISDWELATRLSFFLWSTLPDASLRAAAQSGRLHEPAVLAEQTKRLLADERARRLATEFACQWLHIYEFDQHDEKSPTAFPTFAGLRAAMYEESILFLTDLLRRDGSLLEVFDSDHTFLNEDLAKHYGIPGVTGSAWRRVDGLKKLGRGGVLGMATTLSKQSGASRTSPILRGNWVSEVLLGEKLPKPPKGVPVLPETVPAGLTERQLIEAHSSVASCAKCHARIDPFGFSLEGFDAIGRSRSAVGDKPINTRAKALDGAEIEGLAGLRTYLTTTRRDNLIRQTCKKLLGYALGRAVQLSDEPLLDEIEAKLKANGYRVSVAIASIVNSPQFRTVRVSEPPLATNN